MAKRKDCYTDEQKDEVIAHVLVNVACGRFVSRIFKEDSHVLGTEIKLPEERTFYAWLFADETGELDQKLARAREFGVEALLDEAAIIMDTTQVGEEVTIEKSDPDDENEENEVTVKVKRADMLAHRRLQIETRIKLAQMLKPKKYGPKLDLTSDGKALNDAEMYRAALDRKMKLLDNKEDK